MSLTGISEMFSRSDFDEEEVEVVSRDEKGFVTCRRLKVPKMQFRYLTNEDYREYPVASQPSWSCDYCGGLAPAASHRCANCGAPR